MEVPDVDELVRQLSAGFEALQCEYQKLHGQHQALEKKLTTAREQYNELAKLCGTRQTSTPPLSLTSTSGVQKGEAESLLPVSEILDKSNVIAASKVKAAIAAAHSLRNGIPLSAKHGVRIWSGPLADKPEMPSISESPLEQDFTTEGKPSKLGCPFAGMANKRLSSHAASVLSRYTRSGSVCAVSTQASSAGRVNREQRHSSRRASFIDPIRAEICGMTDHEGPNELPALTKKSSTNADEAEVGVCPIRFLDQHSPEEVATYFERHKHELPRSHEVCVMRYQSNEEQIRQLDAKYGNLVSMIQGLGARHKEMLPEEPQNEPDDDADVEHNEAASNEKVRKWASSVSAQVDGGPPAAGSDDEHGNDHNDIREDRQPHFERPLREIRVGESPSRPWGITVPAKYMESVASSKPVQLTPATHGAAAASSSPLKAAAKCPFGHGAAKVDAELPEKPAVDHEVDAKAKVEEVTSNPKQRDAQILVSGPVFIGYSADDAIRILREVGLPSDQT